MKEKDLKETIGKKLEEAYLAKPMGQAPSEETVAKWIAIADQRRAERRRRKKKIISCAAACALCVCIGVTCVVKPPNAVAGGSGGTNIGTDTETNDIYTSEDQIPKGIQEKFLLFEAMPKGYEFEEATFIGNESLERFRISYRNEDSEEIFVSETSGDGSNSTSATIDSDAIKEQWGELEVYITKYEGGAEETIYVFTYGEVIVSISVPKTIEYEEMRNIIQTAVQG